MLFAFIIFLIKICTLLYPRSPKGKGGILFYLCPSFRPSKIFFVTFFSATIDGRNLIFGHKLHIGTPYHGMRFWTHQMPTSCLPTLLIFIHIEHICSFFITFFSATIDGSYTPTPRRGRGYTVLPLSVCPSFRPSKIFFVAFFSATIDGRNLIFGHKLHIGTPYCGKRFWTHQIPTSCLPTLLIFIHIEHTFCICPFLVTFFSATVDGRNLIFGHKLHIGTPYCGKRFLTHQIPTSCLPKSGGIISEH
jgi:hypothetical protein